MFIYFEKKEKEPHSNVAPSSRLKKVYKCNMKGIFFLPLIHLSLSFLSTQSTINQSFSQSFYLSNYLPILLFFYRISSMNLSVNVSFSLSNPL